MSKMVDFEDVKLCVDLAIKQGYTLKAFREHMNEWDDFVTLIHCKDCRHWNPGKISEKEDFIPPKCKLQKSSWDAYHADHFCGWGEQEEGSYE